MAICVDRLFISVYPFSCVISITLLLCCHIIPLCSGSTVLNTTFSNSYHEYCREGFRCINRRMLRQCGEQNPYLQMNLSTQGPLLDDQFVTVTINGMLKPTHDDWVALMSPANAKISDCPLIDVLYLETGDVASHPLLCHYPVKSQFMKNDPSYLPCNKSRCEKKTGDVCTVKTCSGSLSFHIVNIRTDIEFVLFRGGYDNPCILNTSQPLKFSNPNMPLHAHISSTESTGTSMKVTWISGSNGDQYLQYASGKTSKSTVTTFTQADMCGGTLISSPATDFGWHDPGYIHTAIMTGLLPSQKYVYRYGSDNVGWSDPVQFSTPPAAGASHIKFLAFGDMGKAPLDASDEHYIQPGSLGVIKAMTEEEDVESVFHIGDISYATGFLVEWDFFLHMITALASRVSYMTAIGNHERDFPGSKSIYETTDSGGECGVPYERYFPMPTKTEGKPWYSVSQGPVHFTVISTEHDWTVGSEQYEWIIQDLAFVDRKQTPWLVFTGHRPMYSSIKEGLIRNNVDPKFVAAIEPLLPKYQVDLVLWGHVHNYERTCAVFQNTCKSLPEEDVNGVDTYHTRNYSAPVHVVIGMAGFSLDEFESNPSNWSLVRFSEFGYSRVNATMDELLFEFVNSGTRQVRDTFKIMKQSSSVGTDADLTDRSASQRLAMHTTMHIFFMFIVMQCF
ncbi:probable inactive purple acid phosphatase 27 isoform X2 [Cryptomeria japonica]|uniref:probable inactive purple acid phosphatase 27 isoform X2 n=1 Tax=Cryptomeria japonica TaxID=3369 RepID=UPI0027DA417E|nr:probable inactive purple acid phosphatase 27 isoform X2 [Cryptomeria japonica]